MAGLPCLRPASPGEPDFGVAQAPRRESRFDRGAYTNMADCLTAAYAEHVPPGLCTRR